MYEFRVREKKYSSTLCRLRTLERDRSLPINGLNFLYITVQEVAATITVEKNISRSIVEATDRTPPFEERPTADVLCSVNAPYLYSAGARAVTDVNPNSMACQSQGEICTPLCYGCSDP